MRGRIREFDAADGLGWIDLEDGRAVRFGLSACPAFVPAPDLIVSVDQIEERRGVLRATAVRPHFEAVDLEEAVWPAPLHEQTHECRFIDGVDQTVRVRYRTFERDEALAWPRPDAFVGRAFTPAGASTAPAPHPFFAPWHDDIVATAVTMQVLEPALDGTAGRFGGGFATLVRPWPECAAHGRLALIASIEPVVMKAVLGVARRLTLHVCIECLDRDERAWAGAGAASVEWSEGGTLRATPTPPAFNSIQLRSRPALSFPPAWLFYPRRDVRGHAPIADLTRLLDVGLRLETHYEKARFVYDQHYPADLGDVLIGGYSGHGFDVCPTCVSPLRQVLAIHDYFSGDPGLADVFQGNRRLRLLACDRTPACGGPERGLVISEL